MQKKNRTKNMKENHPVREICSWRRSIQNWKTGTSERPPEFSVARIIQSRRLRTPLQQMQEKHPSDKWSSKLMDLPCVTHTVPYQASEKEVADAVRSFPAGSAGGPDGLRPQHLLDSLNNQKSSAEFLEFLTGFINVLLRGECPKGMRKIMCGGSVFALSKKPRGPETNSYWIHLQKAGCEMRQQIRPKLDSFFAPLQVGVAVAEGGEAVVHASRSFVTDIREA